MSSRDRNTTVYITSNVPILCKLDRPNLPCFSIEFETGGHMNAGSHCEVSFINGSMHANQTLNITFSQNMQMSVAKTYTMSFKNISMIVTGDNTKYFWHGYRPPPIVVIFETLRMGYCKSVADPRITTWDGL